MAECTKCGDFTKYNGGLCYSCFVKDSVRDGDGETFIAEYLDYEYISYKREYVLDNLKGDSKSHRRLDFYLPKYKMGVEFFGGWNNSADERKRYREKKNVYYKNNIPCIYLFPDNLGIIDHIFRRRMTKELKRCNFKKELFYFRAKQLINDRGSLFIWLFLALILIPVVATNNSEDNSLLYILSFILAYQLYRLGKGYLMFFKEKRFKI